MNNNEYQQLYNQYKLKSDEQLTQIINDESYELYARQIAHDILHGDRTEYINFQNNLEREYQQRQTANHNGYNYANYNPQPFTTNDAIFRIAKDVRIIRNIIITTLAVSVGIPFLTLLAYIISEQL